MLDNFHFTIVKSAKDNCLRSDRYFALNLDQLVALTANHTICEAKDGFVKMFIPASFRTEQDRYDPARYDNGDPIINRRTGQPYVRRCAENLIEYSCLPIDIDHGQSTASARQRFGRYTHLGYTSHSHLAKGERFRILIPLATPCPGELYRALKPEWLAFIGEVDPSTVSCSRAFYLPSCPPAYAPFALSWSNTGIPLDWREMADTMFTRMDREDAANRLAEVRRRLEAEKHGTRSVADAQRIRQRLLENLKGHFIGYEPTWTRVAIAMAAEGFSEADFSYISYGLMNSKTTKDCSAKWKSAVAKCAGSKLGVGYLWNVSKGKHDGRH